MRSKIVLVLMMMTQLWSGGAGAARRADEGSAADWIRRMNRALLPAVSARADATLETSAVHEEGQPISLQLSRRTEAGETRTLIEVLAPEAARGTVYEVVARTEELLERWELLPEIRRLRRVTGIARTDAFLGSHFSYEDLEFGAPIQRERGRVDRLRVGSRELVRVTSDPYERYGKVVTLIDPETALPVEVRFYDGSGALHKVQTFERVRRVQGRPVPTLLVMNDVQRQERSVLELRRIRFDVEVPRDISGSPTLQRALQGR